MLWALQRKATGLTSCPNDHVSSGTGLVSPMTTLNVTNALTHPDFDIDQVMARRSPILSVGLWKEGGIFDWKWQGKENKGGDGSTVKLACLLRVCLAEGASEISRITGKRMVAHEMIGTLLYGFRHQRAVLPLPGSFASSFRKSPIKRAAPVSGALTDAEENCRLYEFERLRCERCWYMDCGWSLRFVPWPPGCDLTECFVSERVGDEGVFVHAMGEWTEEKGSTCDTHQPWTVWDVLANWLS